MPINFHHKISGFASKYDVFFVDLWGVIHDGMEAYPGVHQALVDLQSAGKKIIFISNAPRRSSRAIEGLRRLKVEDGLYDSVITSGEVVFEFLQGVNSDSWIVNSKNHHSLPTTHNSRYLIIGPERDSGLLDGTDYIKVETAAEADFMIVTGYDEDDSPEDEKQHYLDEAIGRHIPLICANPDMLVVRISGKRALCAGVIAKKYEQMGGQVLQFGKPYKDVYEKAMQMAGNPDKTRVAAIGDSLTTDILGANNFGLDSYLIPGGILGGELGVKHGELPDTKKLEELCKAYGITPTGVLPEFVY